MNANNSEKEENPHQDEPIYNQNEIKDPQEEAPKENMLDNQQEETKKIFVKNIPFQTNDEQLNKFFSSFGKVIKADVKKKGDGRSSGVGFVEFANVEDKRNVLMMSRKDLVMDGRMLEVTEARPEMDYSKTLYVGNLSSSTTEESLRKFFIDFCQNLKGDFKVTIQTFPNGNLKDYAYVEFQNEEDIANALKTNGEKLDEKNLIVEMKKSRGMGGLRGRNRGRFQRGIGRRGGFGYRRYDYGKERDNNYYRDNGRRRNSRSRSHERSREREGSRERYRRRGDTDRGERDKYKDNRERDRGERRDRIRDRERGDDRGERDRGERERGDKDRGDRDRGDRGDRDRGDRDRGDRDRGDRDRGDRDRGDRDRGDRDRGDRDRGDRDRGDRGDRDKNRERKHMNMDRNQS